MNNIVILKITEYEEIVTQLDQISQLQKQLFLVLKMRNPRPFPSTTRPEARHEEIVRRLDEIAHVQKQLLAALKGHDPRHLP